MDGKQRLALAALSTVPFAMVLGNSMLIPILPQMQRSLDLTSLQTSLVITLFSVPAGLTIPFSGFLSDCLGRKKVIIPALLLYGIGGLVAGAAALMEWGGAFAIILVGRILQGIGAAGTAPIAMALTGDMFQGPVRSKALGVIEAANGGGKVLSPILGSALGLLSWFAPFFVFPVINAFSAGAIWLGVKEPEGLRTRRGIREYLRSFAQVFSKKTALLLTSFFAGSLALLTLFGLLFFLSDHLEQRYRLDGILKGLALAVPVLFMAATAYGTGAVIKRRALLMKILIVSGMGVTAGALALFPCCRTTFFFFTAVSAIGIGTGLVLPCLNTIITSASDADERGLVTALYGGVRFLGVAAGPPLFSLLLGFSLEAMSWVTASASAIAAVLAFAFIRVRDISAQSSPQSRR
ncbi:MAG: MFS transporter [Bacillota bacterium]|nr:MFS transporter [Bacillota bacterium]